MTDIVEQSDRDSASDLAVLEVQDLHVHYPNESGALHAVRGLSFTLSVVYNNLCTVSNRTITVRSSERVVDQLMYATA